jgi:hypothetical protein
MSHDECLHTIWVSHFFIIQRRRRISQRKHENLVSGPGWDPKLPEKNERQNIIGSVASMHLLARTDGFLSTPALYPLLSLLLCIFLFLCTRFLRVSYSPSVLETHDLLVVYYLFADGLSTLDIYLP